MNHGSVIPSADSNSLALMDYSMLIKTTSSLPTQISTEPDLLGSHLGHGERQHAGINAVSYSRNDIYSDFRTQRLECLADARLWSVQFFEHGAHPHCTQRMLKVPA